ncbi:MAG: AraC family transcriptional regulator [Novosphingobium sp.]
MIHNQKLSQGSLLHRQVPDGASLSDFLADLDLRGRTWCIVELHGHGGFSVGPSDALSFYLVLRGEFRLQMANGEMLVMDEGDIVMVISGEAHALRTGSGGASEPLDFFRTAEQSDRPRRIQIGNGEREGVQQILCGRLKVQWQQDLRRLPLPPLLVQKATRRGADAAAAWLRPIKFVFLTRGSAALLTKFASFHLSMAIRDEPQFRELFELGNGVDPIDHAVKLLSSNYTAQWSMLSIAQRVGMSRSSFFARFKKEVGRAPMQFLHERRMEAARELLEHGVPLGEVPAQVGYRSQAAFRRRYSSFFGVPPSDRRVSSRKIRRPTSTGARKNRN